MRAVLAAALALAPAVALAQPDDRDRLPSLTPRVFESRGTIQVSLPDIERQPLSGFGPPPRTFVVPADRQSAVQPFAPDLDALPALALAPPAEPSADDRVVRRFRAEAGGGRDLARYGRVDLAATGAAGEFFVAADYDGIDGEPSRVASDVFEVRAGGQSFARGRLRLEGSAMVDTYSTPAGIASDRRVRRSVGAGVSVEGVGAVPYRLAAAFEQGRLGRAEDSEREVSEGRVDAEGSLALFGDRVRLDAAGGVAGDGGLGTDVEYGAAGLAVVLGRAGGLRLAVGARALASEVEGATSAADAREVGVILDASLPLGPTARVFVQNDPRVGVRSLTDLTGENPFVSASGLVVAPDVVTVDARAGVELRPGAARLRAFALAVRAPAYLVFEAVGSQFAALYDEAEMLGVGGDVALAAPSGLSASAGVEFRTTGAGSGGSLPFVSPVAVRAGAQVPFASDRGRVGLAAYAEAGRPVDRAGTQDASAWGRLSLDARFAVTGALAVVARGERLLGGAERWPGYPEPPFTALLGLRLGR